MRFRIVRPLKAAGAARLGFKKRGDSSGIQFLHSKHICSVRKEEGNINLSVEI